MSEANEPLPGVTTLQKQGTRSGALGERLEHERCKACGYELAGLPRNGACPECAVPVRESVEGYYLRFADPQHLASLRQGCAWIYFLGLCTVLLPIVLMGAITAVPALSTVDPALAVTIAIATIFIGWAASWFLVSRADLNCFERWDAPRLRIWSRRTTVAAAAAVPLGVGAVSGLITVQSEDPLTAWLAIRLIVWTSIVALSLSVGLQMLYLRRQMPRMPGAPLGFRLTLLAIAAPGAGLLIVADDILSFFVTAVGFGLLIALPIALVAFAVYLTVFKKLQTVLSPLSTPGAGYAFLLGRRLRGASKGGKWLSRTLPPKRAATSVPLTEEGRIRVGRLGTVHRGCVLAQTAIAALVVIATVSLFVWGSPLRAAAWGIAAAGSFAAFSVGWLGLTDRHARDMAVPDAPALRLAARLSAVALGVAVLSALAMFSLGIGFESNRSDEEWRVIRALLWLGFVVVLASLAVHWLYLRRLTDWVQAPTAPHYLHSLAWLVPVTAAMIILAVLVPAARGRLSMFFVVLPAMILTGFWNAIDGIRKHIVSCRGAPPDPVDAARLGAHLADSPPPAHEMGYGGRSAS